MVVSNKVYENNNFNIADNPLIIDLDTDIGGRQPFNITIDKKSLTVEKEFNSNEGFVGAKLLKKDEIYSPPKVLRIKLTTTVNGVAFRAEGGID